MKVVIKIIDFTTLAIGIFLGLRIVLKALGASTDAPFVEWLYGITDILLAPFVGIFPSPPLGTEGIIDIPAFFALVIYMALGYALSVGLESLSRNIKLGGMLRATKKSEQKDQHNTHL